MHRLVLLAHFLDTGRFGSVTFAFVSAAGATWASDEFMLKLAEAKLIATR
jgi:hypothetical protein